jgi:error-prone DNA polymerase
LHKSTWGRGGPAVRLGFRQVKGLRGAHADLIVASRWRVGRFHCVAQFHRVTGLPRHTVERLAEAGAFASMGLSRRQALWQTLAMRDTQGLLFDGDWKTDATRAAAAEPDDEPDVALPVMSVGQEVMTDYRTAGLSLKRHPLALLRSELTKMKIITAAELGRLAQGRWVKVAGLVLIRQRPGTASGIVFETIEDKTGVVNLIIRPDLYDRARHAARHAALLEADRYVERNGQVIHVMAKRLIDLSHLLPGYQLASRDFH